MDGTGGRDLILREEVYEIVGAAMEVSNELGCGFLEAVYQEAMAIELRERGIPYASQKRITIKYKEHVLSKEYIADFLCYDQMIVELKATKQITAGDEAQILNYLRATGLRVGVILNFGGAQLEWKRYVNVRRRRPFRWHREGEEPQMNANRGVQYATEAMSVGLRVRWEG